MAEPQSAIQKAAEGTLLVPPGAEPTPDPAFDSLSLPNKINKASLAGRFPETVSTFVGGRHVDLPPDQAQKAIADGTALLPKNVDLHVRLADGSFKVIAPDQFNQYRADGALLASAQEHHQADLGAKYDTGIGSGILAAGLGAARGLSTVPGGGSISDELLGFSSDAQEQAQYLQEHRPTLSGIGEVAGMIGQQALLPGGGIAGLAEKGTARVAGTGLAGRVASTGMRAAVENAQLAHTDLVSEDALGAPPLTAEKYLATVGEAALWGGAIGAGSTLLGAGATALRGALSRTTSAADLDGVAEKAFGYKPKGGVGDALVKAQAVLSGADAEGKEAISNAGVQNWSKGARDLRSTALNIEDVRASAVRDLSTQMDNLLTKTEGIADESRGISKRAHLKAAVQSPLEPIEVQSHAMDSLQGVRDELQAMQADPDTFGNGAALKRIEQQLRGHEKEMVSAVEKGDQAEMFAVLDDTKRTIGGWARKFQASARSGDPLAREQAQEVFAKLGDVERGGGMYEALRKNLEDEGVWGNAGAGQKRINAAWTDYIAASKQMGRAASVTSQVGENNFGRAIYGVDAAKMEKYVAGLVNPNNDLAHKAMADYIRSARGLATAIDDSFELAPAKQAMVSAVKASSIQMDAGLADIGDKLAKVNQIHTLMQAGRGPGGMGAGILGHLIGGAPGALVGGVLGTLASPGKNIMRLAQLESVVSKFDGKVGGAIRRFLERDTAPEVTVGRAARKAGAKGASLDIREEYERRAKVVRGLQDPNALTGRLQEHFGALSGTAPQTASGLAATAARALGYLATRMPQVDPADPLTGKPGTPSTGAMATWLSQAQAIEHPEEVMEDLARGRVTVEQVDALREVYPGIYQEFQSRVQESIAEHIHKGRPLSFQQRISLGILLDVETDPSLAKPAMAHAAASYAIQPEPPQKTGGGRGGPSKLGAAMTTPAQKMEAGGI